MMRFLLTVGTLILFGLHAVAGCCAHHVHVVAGFCCACNETDFNQHTHQAYEVEDSSQCACPQQRSGRACHETSCVWLADEGLALETESKNASLIAGMVSSATREQAARSRNALTLSSEWWPINRRLHGVQCVWLI